MVFTTIYLPLSAIFLIRVFVYFKPHQKMRWSFFGKLFIGG